MNPESINNSDDDHDQDDISVVSNESMSQEDSESEIEDSSIPEYLLAAFESHKKMEPKDKRKFACLRKLLSGKCEKDDCPYNHTREVLTSGGKEIIDKVNEFLQSQGLPNKDNPSRTILPRHKEKYSA